MKKIFTLILTFVSVNLLAQKADVVITNGGVEDVYYSFSNDEISRVSKTTWDIAFTTAGFDASILINENAGVELFLYSNDTADWSSVDTTGFNWNNVYNSTETWEEGAFANQGTSHPDYGWGVYNSDNHNINGNRLFILKNSDDSYSQMVIASMSAAGLYTVKIGDLGGANTNYFTLNKKDEAYADKNFVLYSSVNRAVVNDEPISESWDVLFTKYYIGIQAGPDFVYYPVSGVKVNKGYEVAERSGVATSSNDTMNLTWSSSITEIGSDWKSFNNSTFQYDITSDLTYFIRNAEGDVWKMFFTNYVGGAEGGFYFNVERISGTAGVSSFTANKTLVYPNPITDKLHVKNGFNSSADVSVLNLQGVVILSNIVEANATLTLNAETLASGIYTVSVKTSTQTSNHKLIVE